MIQGNDEIICFIYSSYRNQQKQNKVRLKEGDKELKRQIERERKREDERDICMSKKWKVIRQMPGSSFRKRFKRDKGRSNFHVVFLGGKRYHRTIFFHFVSTWNL